MKNKLIRIAIVDMIWEHLRNIIKWHILGVLGNKPALLCRLIIIELITDCLHIWMYHTKTKDFSWLFIKINVDHKNFYHKRFFSSSEEKKIVVFKKCLTTDVLELFEIVLFLISNITVFTANIYGLNSLLKRSTSSTKISFLI